MLVGRSAELDTLDRLLRGVGARGAAVLVRGEPGIGKSALLEKVRETAADRGLRTLRTTGLESESTLPFAGLHQLVQPLLGRLTALPPPQRRALKAAFGLTDDASPGLFLVGLAALTLISDSAAERPTVLLVDDAHWLDRPSAEVLAFVARRLDSEPVVMLVAQRDGFPVVVEGPGLVECRLERLADGAAEELLALRAPALAPEDRLRLLDEAAGNPLALVELPSGVGGDRCAPLSLTDRLEQAFAARLSELLGPTRTLLLVAALNESDALREALVAASALAGQPVEADALAPAVEAQLVRSDGTAVTFHHPLVRHAIRQRADPEDLRRAHTALAQTLGDVDREVWHRAAACDAPDDALAADLEAAAGRARRRGGVAAAETMLERAARTTADPGRRADRYLRAAELAYEWGRQDVVDRLLRETAALEVPAAQRTRLGWVRASFDEGVHDAGAAPAGWPRRPPPRRRRARRTWLSTSSTTRPYGAGGPTRARVRRRASSRSSRRCRSTRTTPGSWRCSRSPLPSTAVRTWRSGCAAWRRVRSTRTGRGWRGPRLPWWGPSTSASTS